MNHFIVQLVESINHENNFTFLKKDNIAVTSVESYINTICDRGSVRQKQFVCTFFIIIQTNS